MKIRIRYIKFAVLCLALALLLTSCSFPIGKKNNANEAENVVEEPTFEISIRELQETADKSSGLWEMLGFLFPENVVYKDASGHFVLAPVNQDLTPNKYDWGDLSKSIRGIDVSKYQGNIDWTKVARENVNFAFIRIGYRGYETGKMVMDEKFKYNIENALQNGVPVGVYFVTKAVNPEEGAEEARWIIDNIRAYNVTWPIVMDFESAKDETDRTFHMSPEMRTEVIIAFCETLKEAGYTPMLYGGVGTYMTKMDITKLDEYPRWFAQYFNQPHFPYAIQIWQATDSGSIEGIKGNVDIDYAMFNFSTGQDVAPSEEAENPPK